MGVLILSLIDNILNLAEKAVSLSRGLNDGLDIVNLPKGAVV